MQGNEMSQRQGQLMAQVAQYYVGRASQAKALRATVKAYNPDAGDAVDSMGVDQLEGMLKGWGMKNAADLQNAHMQDFTAQAEQRRQLAADDQSIGDAVNRYANAPDKTAPLLADDTGGEGPTTMRPATPDERFKYALGTPGLSGRAVPKLIDALSKYGQSVEDNSPTVLKDNPYPGVSVIVPRGGRGAMHVVNDPNSPGEKLNPTYTEDPVTGARALLYGKSAEPTGFNPAKAAPTLMPQHDEEGNLVGWSQLDARGHATFIANKAGSGKLKTATDEAGNPIPGYYVDPQGKLHDTRSALEKSLGTAKVAPDAKSAAPKAPAQIKTKADFDALASGSTYIGKDGRRYLKP